MQQILNQPVRRSKARSKRATFAVVAFLMMLAAATGLPAPASASTVQDATSVAEILAAPDYSFDDHAPILRLYQAIFDRTPDVGGAKYWIDINNQGNNVLAIAGFMSESVEWTNNYKGTNDEEFLTRVYSNVLGRDFDQGGFNYWLDTLRGTNQHGGNPEMTTLGRHEVVFYITANPEFTNAYPFAGTYEPPTAPAGSGGNLTLLQWQAPSQANGLTTRSTKDLLAGSLVLEPLAEFTPDGGLRPVLAATVPTLTNGGIAPDRRSVRWQLKNDVVWSDGTPFTSSDVIFTWEYCRSLDSGCADLDGSAYGIVSMLANGPHSVTIVFDRPMPNPYLAFVGYSSPVLQKSQFAACDTPELGCIVESRAPIGTGPFRVVEAIPDDRYSYEWNPLFRGADIGQPFFATVEIIGGGDAESAARSVLEDGVGDYAWNLVVAPEVLSPMEAAGLGRLASGTAANVEGLRLNQTDPDGNPPSEFAGGANPFFYENPQLHRALSLAIDRDALATVGYGAAGQPTCNFWPVGESPSTNNDWCLVRDVAEANRILDEDLGYLDINDDGIRELPDGTPLSFDLVTSTNGARQSIQALIKSDWEDIGVAATLADVDGSEFFDSDCVSDLCIWKFFTDIQMYTNGTSVPDAAAYLGQFTADNIPTSAGEWEGSNIPRLNNPNYDAIIASLQGLSPDESGYDQLVIEANDIISTTIIPLILRGNVSAFSNSIQNVGELNGWDSEYYNIEEWTRVD